jgi:hypothetical protein
LRVIRLEGIKSKYPLAYASLIFFGAALLMIIFAAAWLQYTAGSSQSYRLSDIGAIWREGDRLCHSTNPYARIQAHPEKPIKHAPNYLPGLYILACGLEFLGYDSNDKFEALWGPIVLLLQLTLGLGFFIFFFRRGQAGLAFFALTVWLFSRFSVHTVTSRQPNTLALLPLLLSLVLYDSRKNISLVLFSLSLCMKHVAVFLLPLYLIWCWQTGKTRVELARNVAWFTALPALLLLPFLIWDHHSLFQSLLYPTSRPPSLGSYKGYPEFIANVHQSLPRLLMLLSMCLIYITALRRQLPRLSAAFLVMFCFVAFNPTIFTQYFFWCFAVMLLAICDWLPAKSAPRPAAPASGAFQQ